MLIQAYPFLVSRNRSLDYRTVVAPSFFINEGIANFLARAAGGNLTSPGHAIHREMQGTQLGDFTLVFHVVEANQKDIYPDKENEVLTDPFGREIFLIEGIVFKGKPDKFSVSQEVFGFIHEQLLDSYRSFWEDTNLFDAPVVSVKHLDFNGKSQAEKTLILDEVEPFVLQRESNKQPSIPESERSDITRASSPNQSEIPDILNSLKSLPSEKIVILLVGGALGLSLLIFLINKLIKFISR